MPPERLSLHSFFTRIFLSIWAVIVLIAAGAAAVTAIDFAAAPDRPSTVVRAAREVLNRDGLSGLRVWLAEHNRRARGTRTLIIDSIGKDILGQRLPRGFRGPPPGSAREGFPPPLPSNGLGDAGSPPPRPNAGEHDRPPPANGDEADRGARPPRREFFRAFGEGPGPRGGPPFAF